MKNTSTRKETFARNKAIIDLNLAHIHKEALGEDTWINKLGYPDIGNNKYAEFLPYRDWVKINNP